MSTVTDPDQALPEIKYVPWSVRTPWMFRWRGRRYFSKSERAAIRKRREKLAGSPTLTKREQEEYLHARELLGSTPLIAAVRHYLEANPRVDRSERSAKVVERFIAQINDGRPKYVAEMKRNLKLLAAKIGEIRMADLTEETFRNAIAAMPTYNAKVDLRKYASVFCNWCLTQKLLRANLARQVPKPPRPRVARGEQRKQGFLSVADAALLLRLARREFPRIVAGVALQAFLGIRTEEVTRLRWDAIKPGRSVVIEPWVGKMGEARARRDIIDWWPPRLSAWLPPAPAATVNPGSKALEPAPVVPSNYMDLRGDLVRRCRAVRATGFIPVDGVSCLSPYRPRPLREPGPELPAFRFPQNALRHSFATYGVAFLESAEKVARIMRQTDAGLVYSTYAEYATKGEGVAYFFLAPGRTATAWACAAASTSRKRSSRMVRR